MPWITDVKDVERYPRDRRTLRWRGEYVFVVLGVAVVAVAILMARGTL